MKVKIFMVPAFIAAVLMTGCASLQSVLKEPEISADSFEITKINFDSADILCRVKVDNPNAVSVPFPAVDWELFINGNPFIKGDISDDSKIAASSISYIDLPASISYSDLYRAVRSSIDADEAEYKMAAGFTFDLPLFGKKRYEVDFSGVIPMVKIPEISVDSINLSSIGLDKADFNVNVGIKNNNSFAMTLENFNYDFKVNGVRWMEGTTKNLSAIPSGGKVSVPLDISIKTLNTVSGILSLIKSGEEIEYDLEGALNILPSYPGFDLTKFPFKLSGSKKIGR